MLSGINIVSKLTFLFSLTFIFPATSVLAWRSELVPNNWTPPTALKFETDKMIQDFSYAGYRRGNTSIPGVTGPMFNVKNYGADSTGSADATAAIQKAIDAAGAAGGGVVYLPAGTFKVKPQGNNQYALVIRHNHIVLRGAGKNSTFIFNDDHMMRNKSIIEIESRPFSWTTVPSGSLVPTITQDLLSPTTAIPVSSVSGLKIGDWVVLRADFTDAFAIDHNILDLWGGGVFSASQGVMFYRQITAIDTAKKTVTIDVPIRYYLKQRDNARLHRVLPHREEVGLENFSIGNREHPDAGNGSGSDWGDSAWSISGRGGYSVHNSRAIRFLGVRNSWVANVASYRPAVNKSETQVLSHGIVFYDCAAITVQNTEMQRSMYGGGGGNGYLFRLDSVNEVLIKNSLAAFGRHLYLFSGMRTSGNVIHRSTARYGGRQVAGNGNTGGVSSDHHAHLSQSNLVDDVQVENDFFAAPWRGSSGGTPRHALTGVHSVFWNLEGLSYFSNIYSQVNYIVLSNQARYGYIIGTRGSAGNATVGGVNSYTEPRDHLEGVGLGGTLEPSSLYEYQYNRRRDLSARVPSAPTDFVIE